MRERKKGIGSYLFALVMIMMVLLPGNVSAGDAVPTAAATPDASPAPTMEVMAEATVSTPSGPLKMRKEASDSASIVTTIPNKKIVTVLYVDGEWAQVTYKKHTGYVKRVYLVDAGKAAASETKSLIYPGLPITFVRNEPSEDAEIIGQMFDLSYFTVLTRGQEWTKIGYGDNETGYVLTSTLKPETQEEKDASPSQHQFTYAELTSDQKVFKNAESSAEIIGSLKEGTVVEVYYAVGGWSNASDGIMQGWVKTGALDFKNDTVPASNGSLTDLTANYYTATAKDKIVQLYFHPTAATADNHYITLRLGEKDKLMVLVRSLEAGGLVWSQVSDGEYVGWTVAADLSVSDKMETYSYKEPVASGATGVAYAREDGVKVYDGYPQDGNVLCTLHKDEEIIIQLTVSQDFVAVLRGGSYYGNVKKSDITIGLMDAEKTIAKKNKGNPVSKNVPRGTPAPKKTYDGMTGISKETARSIGESALESKYEAFAGPSAYKVITAYHDNEPTQFEQPYWQFDYMAPRADHPDLDIVKFTVMVHAYTQEVIYTTQGWEPDLTEIDYSTPTPAPFYSDDEMANPLSKEDALSIGESALKSKYPDFDPSAYTLHTRYVETSSGFDPPYWQFNYLDDRGSAEYSVYVHAYTRKVIYTCDPKGGNG